MIRNKRIFCDICKREIKGAFFTGLDYSYRGSIFTIRLYNDICRCCRDAIASLRLNYVYHDNTNTHKFLAKKNIDKGWME